MSDPISGVAATKEGFGLLKEIIPYLIRGWKYISRSHIPRAAKGSVGFAVAISTEKAAHRERLASDFIDTLRQQLINCELKQPFSFVEIPHYIAAKIKTPEEARKVLTASKCRFLIFGKAKLRIVDGTETNVLELNSAVSHKEIDPTIQAKLSQEMNELLPPPRMLSKTDGDIFAFELHAYWLNFVARYIIGIAAFLSEDVAYAQSVFEQLEQQLKGVQLNLSQITELKKRVPSNLTNILQWQAIIRHLRWRSTRDIECLKDMKVFLGMVEARDPGRYQVLLLNAIYYFVVEKNVKRALQMMEKCKNVEDPTWKYSKAFLLAYNGRMNDAVRTYKAAFKIPTKDTSVPFEIEEFIDWVVNQEPSKTQLHFCLGLINIRLKEDMRRAKQDFKMFLESTPENQFSEQRELAQKYIAECND